MNLLNRLKAIFDYVKLMGISWFIFRVKYELFKKINYFDKVNISILKKVSEVKKNSFFYKRIKLVNYDFIGDESFIKKAENAIHGNIFSFSNEYLNYLESSKINWNINPITKVSSNLSVSWNKLPDFGEYGDIKLIWEASRFPQVYYFINSYSLTKEKKYAKECINQILDWIENNPFPYGVNYKCGQEITFRIFSWIIAIEYFAEFLNVEDEEKIIENIYTSLLRIDANIDYAAKSVKNNHSISEAAGLFIGGLLLSQFDESNRLVEKGLNYLQRETSYQVYEDGSYIQHSFTYQRLALDVLSFVFLISNKLNYKLPVEIKNRHQKMIIFLNSFIQENGQLPNYGSNDGANLFPLTGDSYRDFRSSLNFASVVNSGYSLFKGHKKLFEFFNTIDKKEVFLDKKIEFPYGGYYILKNKNLFAFIRCHSYKHRPASNDMFHLDIWYKGKNLFCDTGSYSYNTHKDFKNNFIGTVGHNTVTINDKNQMTQVLNFGWSNWTKAKCLDFNSHFFRANNYSYEKSFGVIHKRSVELYDNKLVIFDRIENIKEKINIKQIWNTKFDVEVIDKYTLKLNGCIVSSNFEFKIEKSYISDYYNSYFEGNRVVFYADSYKDIEIKTIMDFQ